MSKSKLIKTKENKKSTVYELGDYELRTIENNGVVYKKNGEDFTYEDPNLEAGTYKHERFGTLKVKNMKTGKISQKRIHQPDAQALSDFEADINGSKAQFRSIFDKIDPKQ